MINFKIGDLVEFNDNFQKHEFNRHNVGLVVSEKIINNRDGTKFVKVKWARGDKDLKDLLGYSDNESFIMNTSLRAIRKVL